MTLGKNSSLISSFQEVLTITSMKFHSILNNLLVIATHNTFYLYDIVKKEFTEWSKEYSVKIPERLKSEHLPIEHFMGISFNPSKPNHILFYCSSFFLIVDISQVYC